MKKKNSVKKIKSKKGDTMKKKNSVKKIKSKKGGTIQKKKRKRKSSNYFDPNSDSDYEPAAKKSRQ